MKKIVFFLLTFFYLFNSESQTNNSEIDSLNTKWNLEGKFSFLGNQTSYSYWTAGGQTSVSGTIKIDYDFNFEDNGWNWDTKLTTAYGLNSIGGSKFLKKTEDRIEINSLIGKKFTNNLIGNWSYSSFINFKTQWTKGYRFSKDSDGQEIRNEISRFFSPAFLQIGIGLYWEKDKKLWVNTAPFTGRLIMVNKFFTKDLVPPNQYFGVNKDQNSRFELGASIRSFYKVELIENVIITNSLSLYSDYLNNPENIDLDYTFDAVMKINKFLTTNLIIQLIYDDNSVKRLQLREVFGIGINLNI